MIGNILIFSKVLCYFVLTFYLVKVVILIIYGKDKNDHHNLRDAMALVYAGFAVYFIFESIDAIQILVQHIVEGINLAKLNYEWLYISLYTVVGLIFTSFICNFCRSLWMLKSLEHGMFEAVPDWEQLLMPKRRRGLEFLTRTCAAILFILLEFELKKWKGYDGVVQIQDVSSGNFGRFDLSYSGLLGIFLYLSLICWWFSGLYAAGTKMPKGQLLFYICGMVISGFVLFYGSPITTDERLLLVLILLTLALAASLFMIFIVVREVATGTFDTLKLLFARDK